MSENESPNQPEPQPDEVAGEQEGGSELLAPATGTRHPMLLYTVARFGILAGCLGIVYLVGARGILWIIISFVISALLSYTLLGKLRDQIGAGFGTHFDKLNDQVAEQEDDLDQGQEPDSGPDSDNQSGR